MKFKVGDRVAWDNPEPTDDRTDRVSIGYVTAAFQPGAFSVGNLGGFFESQYRVSGRTDWLPESKLMDATL